MRFDYYRRLGKADRAIYRQSDEYDRVELDDVPALVPLAASLGPALERDDRVRVERLAQRLVSGVCSQLEIATASVRVLDERPRSATEELHGLYYPKEGERPVILVWMRTARRRRPVAHRAFLRTLLHEVVHHLDYALLELADSFHTQGFFQRESSLMRQLLPPDASPPRSARPPRLLARPPAPVVPLPSQLELFAQGRPRRGDH